MNKLCGSMYENMYKHMYNQLYNDIKSEVFALFQKEESTKNKKLQILKILKKHNLIHRLKIIQMMNQMMNKL